MFREIACRVKEEGESSNEVKVIWVICSGVVPESIVRGCSDWNDVSRSGCDGVMFNGVGCGEEVVYEKEVKFEMYDEI